MSQGQKSSDAIGEEGFSSAALPLHSGANESARTATSHDVSEDPQTVYGKTYTTPSSFPAAATAAVLQPSVPLPVDTLHVKGVTWSATPSLEGLATSLLTTGFQATHLGRAIEVVNAMLDWQPPTKEERRRQKESRKAEKDRRKQVREILREHGLPTEIDGSGGSEDSCSSEDSYSSEEEEDMPSEQHGNQQQSEQQLVLRPKKQDRCSIWLSFTSNMISSGLREAFVFLAKHKMIVAAVTSAGGVEEDIIKCLGPTVVGDFALKGSVLRRKGWNRIGNLIVPNENYCKFEDWLQPHLDRLLQRQQERLARAMERAQLQKEPVNLSEVVLTPSDITRYLGEAIETHPRHEESFLYWCWKNDIPVFCPGLTDGSLGDNIFFHTYRNPGLVVDVAKDVRRANDLAAGSRCSGLLILGGGLPKHHTLLTRYRIRFLPDFVLKRSSKAVLSIVNKEVASAGLRDAQATLCGVG
ncbi:deoxyhypusine synthase [Cyclospora cayetanensis]|uniref:Deoxyhypusine synthase n=1 Tax=Cyclospora cayetanensis TaxID=88456 RepID=A0A1D3D6D8_9EIME|nr:deoxyhypusine synthase [Cyclospora cayetanensis]